MRKHGWIIVFVLACVCSDLRGAVYSPRILSAHNGDTHGSSKSVETTMARAGGGYVIPVGAGPEDELIRTSVLSVAKDQAHRDEVGDEGGEGVLAHAYLLDADLIDVIERLQEEGVEVEELREDVDLEVARYGVESGGGDGKEKSRSGGWGEPEFRTVLAGTILVRTGQKEGKTAATLLELEVERRFTAMAGIDLKERGFLPVERVERPVGLLASAIPRKKEKRAERRRVTFEVVHGKEKVNFNGAPTRIERWLGGGVEFLQVRGDRLHRVEAESGRARPFLASDRIEKALRGLAPMSEKAAKSISQRTNLTLTSDFTGALVEHENDLYFFRLDGSLAVRLTATPGKEEIPSFSPDGKFVAFVRADNLHVVDVATQTERALTTDGGGDVRNGKADWIYFEEVYNRDWKAYWWSPDSRHLAFQQFNDAGLPMFHALNTLPLHGQLESMRHPKAGDPNPVVRLGVVSVGGSDVRWVELRDYVPGSSLITLAGWFPKGDKLFYYHQDRAQKWLDCLTWNLESGSSELLFRDQTEAWIESPGAPHFLKSGAFFLTSDRSGWNHIYRFQPQTRRWRAITQGRWDVRKVHLVDQTNRWIYFTGTRESAVAEHLYRCKFNGSSLEQLTRREGTHRVLVDPAGRYFIDVWSRYTEPEQVRLYAADGTFVRVLDTNPVHALEDFEFGETEFFQIESQDGFRYEAALIYPPDFDARKKYPVWFTTYGGPSAPSVRDVRSGAFAQDQLLAQMGVIVFRMDPRSASGKGSVWAWKAYRQLGVQELADITEGIEWLKGKPFVDGDRIGMSGHSYGGFMTAYAMTHSRLFAAGIAGAPVTDWRYYDSIYTERYMDTPQNNRDGYDRTSVVRAAGNLHGRLLLLHGMMDDNVHLQNATQLVNALQKAEKSFEVMFYPEMKHGLSGAHYNRLLLDFIRRTVLDSLKTDF